MSVTYHRDLIQGTDAWIEARRGLMTASEMNLVLTPKLAIANNEKVRLHVYELLAQRITGYVEPRFISDDMLRGQEDEQLALSRYHQEVAEVSYCGFITNDKWGFTLGYSPDGLVGDNGLVEAKSRMQKHQMATICQHVHGVEATTIPGDFLLQCQAGMLIAERKWLDFISYCGGLPMVVIRIFSNDKVQDAIVEACAAFEESIANQRRIYDDAKANYAWLFDTERTEREIIL